MIQNRHKLDEFYRKLNASKEKVKSKKAKGNLFFSFYLFTLLAL